MTNEEKETYYLTTLFQNEKSEVNKIAPSFETVYKKAQLKYRMKLTKWIIVASFLVAVLISSLVYTNYDKTRNLPKVQAGTSLYQILIEDGKIVTYEIFFEYDRATLRSESQSTIDAIGTMLKEHPKVNLRIEGHTDNTGSATYNKELSTMRAAAVKQALLKLGVEDNRLVYKGLGEEKPIASNDSEAGRQKNRRVELVLIK